MQNPFDISFGKRPLQNISRIRQTNEIIEAFSSPLITQQLFMITGVRGSGKTVLMNTIANSFEGRKDWIVIRLNPDRDLLQSLGAKLSSDKASADIFKNAKLNLSLFGFGIEINNTPPIADIESAIENMMTHLKKHKKRVLITIDEVTSTPYLRAFCSFFQIMIGQELPVFLLMTGLYENIYELQNVKNLTFLYRAPKIILEPLNLGSIASSYEGIFNISHEEGLLMARLTKGYPFAFQALGYVTWKYQSRNDEAMNEYRQILEEYVYEKIWSELSPKDRRILDGIAHCPDGQIKEINQYLHLKKDEINQYRRRLIRKGLIHSESYGHLSFSLPLFDTFVLDQGIS